MASAIDEALARLVGRGSRHEQLFETAVELLTTVTGWRFAAIGALNPERGGVSMLAVNLDGKAQPCWQYELEGTPCCDVYNGSVDDPYWFVGNGLADKFPEDKALRDRGFTAYRGELFFDDRGESTGHVFMMDDRPREDEEQARWFFRLITQRIGAEYNRMQMEERLAVQQGRYARATTAGNIGVWEWNLVTGDVDFSRNLEVMLGCAEGEHIRHIDEWLAHVDDALGQKVIAESERVRRGERLEETISEYSVSLPDGSRRWFEARAKPILEEDGTIVTLVGTDTDITERKKIEQELLVAKDAAEKANRAKSEFLATMSHEFRTPLNAILGFSELMRSGALGPIQNPAFEEYLGDIHRSGMHMLALVNDVLDIAAIEAGKRTIARQPLNISDLFETTVRSAQSLPGGDALSFDIDTPPDLPDLYADERAIVQVFNNLLSNAVKFTDAGGEIRLRARTDADQFILSVVDTGHGIPAEKLHVVTQPFSQVSTNPHVAEHSTGLGLAIVKSLVDFHDGELRIESEPGVGTEVSIILPMGSNGSASA